MVGPIDVKRKGSASDGNWVQYVTLTFDLTHDLDLGCFKVTFRNSALRNCWSDWYKMKRKWVNMILGRLYDLVLWPHIWPWAWKFKVRAWIALCQQWGGRLTWNEKDVIDSWSGYWLVWPWWGERMYRIATGVTSDVSVSTYVVLHNIYLSLFWDHIFLKCNNP